MADQEPMHRASLQRATAAHRGRAGGRCSEPASGMTRAAHRPVRLHWVDPASTRIAAA